MYCLDCGTKIEDGKPRCPHCGLPVAEMKRRLAEAEEKIAYTDAVSPTVTGKLPLVKDRTYVDGQGNPLDPSDEVDVERFRPHKDDLTAIPSIGDSDPFVTMPMQRIVSDSGEVVADVDHNAKTYRQDPPKKPFPRKPIIAVCFAAVIVAIGVFKGPELWALLPFDDMVAEDEQRAQAEQKIDEQRTAEANAEQIDDFFTELKQAYKGLALSRTEVDGAVEDLEGYFLVVNRDTRQGHADDCKALIDDLTAERADLADLAKGEAVSVDAELQGKWKKVDALYGYLLDRLDVISQCWEKSLSYDDPRDYSSEILSPLKDDLEQGSSVSEAKFDAAYPKADPS